MLTPFKRHRAGLAAAEYRCSPQLDVTIETTGFYTVMFGGNIACLVHAKGGSYSDNGGRNYSATDMEVCPRFQTDHACRQAIVDCLDANPTYRTSLTKLPKSNQDAEALLSAARAFDELCVSWLEKAREEVERKRIATTARLERNLVMAELSAIRAGEMSDEVMRLYREGLLNDHSSMKRLRDIAGRCADLENLCRR